MRMLVIPIDFMGQAPLYEPKDRKLHDAAVQYCKENLADQLDFVRLNKVWVAIEEPAFDDKGMFVSGTISGITGYVLKPDIPLFRVTGANASRATKMLTDRLHDHFGDQGLRGSEVFVHVSSKESPDQKCAAWQDGLKATDAKLADRYSVIVR